MGKVVLQVKNIVKNFAGVQALKGVDFDVMEGEVHALCGENGAGKSTLMHILSGVYPQDSGDIYFNNEKIKPANQKHAQKLGIGIVYQERSLVNGISVAENIFAARQPVKWASFIDFKKLYSDAEKLLKELDIHIDPKAMVGELSPAMKQMVEIAKALSLSPKILILDEPTATITKREIEPLFKLIKVLKRRKMAIIYISHRLVEIFDIADRVTVFKDGSHVATELTQNIDTAWIVNKMVGRDLEFTRVPSEAQCEKVLECKNLNSRLFKDVSFYLKRGEILSFAGLVGAGRTEVMRAIFGTDKKQSGEIYIEGKKAKIKTPKDAIKYGIGYLPEDRREQGLFLEMSVSKNIISASWQKLCKTFLTNAVKGNEAAEDMVKKLHIVTPSIKQKVVNLSGGNQQKIIVAKWLLACPSIMIVDEPTRGIDVGAKAEIYSLLRQLARQGTSIIVISSELPEVLALSDRIYVMHNKMIRAEMSGDEATEEHIMKYASGLM